MSTARNTNTARTTNDVEFVSSAEALAMLGVRRETFYTYVSRGLIKSRAVAGQRQREYRKADLEKLKTRAAARSGTRITQALRYGEPLVQTWISDVTSQGPSYRGELAVDLARQDRPFELVSEMLWRGGLQARSAAWPVMALPPALMRLGRADDDASCIGLLLHAATALKREGTPRLVRPEDEAIRMVQALAGVCAVRGPAGRFTAVRKNEAIAAHLCRALGAPSGSESIMLLNATLVLCADNELSAPTFAARICASTGASLPACVISALATQSGPMQVGGTEAVEDLFDQVLATRRHQRTAATGTAVADLPCFGHPLYERDPRAIALLDRIHRFEHCNPAMRPLLDFIGEAQTQGQHPNIFALCVLVSRVLGLPRGSGALLHTVARSVGWIAHTFEQRLAGAMLRPRAKYMGRHGPSGSG